MVELLIKYGADVNKGSPGKTPIWIALKMEKKEIFDVLVDAGAMLQVFTRRGTTLLAYAACQDKSHYLERILAAGVDPCAIDILGNNAFFAMARIGFNPRAVPFLVAHGLDVNRRNYKGLTPLFPASLRGNPKYAATFLRAGAIVNVCSLDGETPLIYALREGIRGSVEVLIAAGADINAVDYENRSPLYWSLHHGFISIAKILISLGAVVPPIIHSKKRNFYLGSKRTDKLLESTPEILQTADQTNLHLEAIRKKYWLTKQ